MRATPMFTFDRDAYLASFLSDEANRSTPQDEFMFNVVHGQAFDAFIDDVLWDMERRATAASNHNASNDAQRQQLIDGQ